MFTRGSRYQAVEESEYVQADGRTLRYKRIDPPPPPAGEPGPIAGQGYTVRFQDDFNSLDATDWGTGIWYDPGSPPNSIFVPVDGRVPDSSRTPCATAKSCS